MLAAEATTDRTPDEVIVQRVQAGDSGLFQVLMRRYNQRLFRVTRSILQDEAEAEDVMQEAYVRAFGGLPKFRGQASFATWLTKIAIHEALARRRSRKRLVPLDNLLEFGALAKAQGRADEDPERRAGNAQLRAILEAGIDALPERLRLVFVLREVEGLDTQATARSLGISLESVRVRLHRARASLRRELKRRLGAASGELFAFHERRCDRLVTRVLERIQG